MEAPLGLVLLVALGVVTLLYLLFTLGLETAALLEVRRYARELLHYKKLAEDAEQSRFTELRRYLEGEFQALREAEREELRALKEEVAETLEKHGNTLAAYIGKPRTRSCASWASASRTPEAKRPHLVWTATRGPLGKAPCPAGTG